MPEAFKVINCSDVMNIVGCEPEDLKRFDLFLYTKYEGAICIIAAKSPMSEDLIRQWFLDRPLKQNDDICQLDSKKPKTESTVTAVYTEYSNVFNISQTKVTYNHHQRHHRNHSFSHCPNTTIRKDRVVKRLTQKLQERRKCKEITEVELDSVTGCDTPDSNLGVELDNGHQQENNLNVGNDFGNDVLNDIDHSKRNKNKNSGTKENQPTISIPGVDNKDKLSYNETASNSSDPHIEKCFWGSQNINQVFKNLPSQRSTSVGAENNYKRAKYHDEIKRKQNKTFRDKNEVLFEEEHYSIGCRKLQREDGKNVEFSRLIQQCRDLTNLPSSEIRRQTTLVVYPAKQSKGSGKSGNRRGQANRAGTSRGSDGSDGTPGLSIQVTDTSTESLRRPPRELDVTSTQPVGGSLMAPTIGTRAQEQDLISSIWGERRTSGQDLPVVPARYPVYMNQPARQQSFRNWPSTTGQDASRMAEYGFFYKGQVDHVQCFQCGIWLKDWGPGDNPLFEHKRHSPQCIFLRDLLKKNQENLHMNDSQPGVNAPNSGNRTRYHQYETLQSRLDSFSNWPSTARQTPQSLAEAGLFYTGFNDLCRCYHCGGGLRRWEGEDVPWVEHARWYPNCNYVKQLKGQTFINMVRRASEEGSREDKDPPVLANEIPELQNQIITSPFNAMTIDNFREFDATAYSALDLFFSKTAVQIIDENNRSEDQQNCRIPNPDLPSVGNSRRTRTQPLTHSMFKTAIEEIIALKKELGKKSEEAEKQKRDQNTLAEENKNLKEKMICKICLDKDADIVFLPCGHMISCIECAQALRKCAICRKLIEGRIRTFIG